MSDKRQCGNCGERVRFTISYLGRSSADIGELLGTARGINSGFSYSNRPDDRGPEVYAAAMAPCPECTKPTLLYVKAPFKNLELIRQALEKRTSPVNPGFEIVEAFPAPKVAETSGNWPEKIQKLFRGAQEHHKNSNVPEMTISACRSVMDVAINDLGGKGRFFRDKIQDLQDKGVITASIRQWAFEVWKDGSKAVHEIEGTEEEAEILIEFLKTFLSVVYDLPAGIREKGGLQSLDP